jgi:hypothetical protein
MDAVREQMRNPVVVGVIGFFIGVIFGLVVLGWWLWPVEWTNANPEDMMPEEQSEYLRMSIEAYGYNGDGERAQLRYSRLGEDVESAMESIEINPENMDAKLLLDYKAAVSAPSSMLEEDEPAPEAGATLSAEEILLPEGAEGDQVEESQVEETVPEEGESKSLLGTFWPVVCLVVIVIGAAGVVLFILRGRGSQEPQPQLEPDETDMPPNEVPWEEYTSPPEEISEEPLVGQYMASYQHGDEMFDDSFSIDSPTGEFLGECGIGISETVGVGDPKRVTAFDIWLFDKNDIQTVTKVLMSNSAFNDSELRQQVAAKGEPIQVEIGGRTILETQTLNMEAEVVDMTYGEGAVPQESFFERLIVEFRITQKS